MSSVPLVRRFLELSFNVTSIWLLNLIEARKFLGKVVKSIFGEFF